MKKFLLLFLIFMFTNLSVFAEEPLKASVSLIDKVPAGLFGSWKVLSVQISCSNPMLNVPFSIDEWNLSRQNNVLTLVNPQSGASASVKINEVRGNTVKFTRTSFSEVEHVIETPEITINGENFVGTDKIVVENYKYGKHVSTDVWMFKVKAKKMSGTSTQQLLKR